MFAAFSRYPLQTLAYMLDSLSAPSCTVLHGKRLFGFQVTQSYARKARWRGLAGGCVDTARQVIASWRLSGVT
jgi:hypothetical protein